MAYENLDAQDKAICEALERGVTPEEIVSQFGVELSKVEALKPVVLEKVGADKEVGETEVAPTPEVTDEPASDAQGETFQG